MVLVKSYVKGVLAKAKGVPFMTNILTNFLSKTFCSAGVVLEVDGTSSAA